MPLVTLILALSPAPGLCSQGPGGSMLTDQEWAAVNRENNPARRVRKLLEAGARRIDQAQTLARQENYADAASVLKGYRAILTYTMNYLEGLAGTAKKQQRNAYKEFDLRLRAQIRTLTESRPLFPAQHRAVEEALTTARRLRIIALNRFSGGEILKVPEGEP